MQAIAFEQSLDRYYELKFISDVDYHIKEVVDKNGYTIPVRNKGTTSLKKVYEIAPNCEIIMTVRGNDILVAEAGDKIEILSTLNNGFPTAFNLVKAKRSRKTIGTHGGHQFAKINDIYPREL
jgi:hypothetical protein